MAVTPDFVTYVLDQLSALGKVRSRRMFGGVGIDLDGVFFALIDSDVLYLKAGEENRADFEARGMRPFRPFKDKPLYSMSYYELPAEVLEDTEECAAWARRALAVAAAARAKPRAAAKKKKATNVKIAKHRAKSAPRRR